MNKNVTLNLPSDLIHKAKIYAAERETTLNAIVRTLLTDTLYREDRVRASAIRFLELAETGTSSPVDPRSFQRAELHERW